MNLLVGSQIEHAIKCLPLTIKHLDIEVRSTIADQAMYGLSSLFLAS